MPYPIARLAALCSLFVLLACSSSSSDPGATGPVDGGKSANGSLCRRPDLDGKCPHPNDRPLLYVVCPDWEYDAAALLDAAGNPRECDELADGSGLCCKFAAP